MSDSSSKSEHKIVSEELQSGLLLEVTTVLTFVSVSACWLGSVGFPNWRQSNS